MQLPKPRGIWNVGLLVTCCLMAGGVTRAETVDEWVAGANRLTKSAKTIDDYTAILQLCSKIEGQVAEGAQRRYAVQLSAWAHNRIGEIHVKTAGELQGKGQSEQARRSDDLALRHFEVAIKKNPKHWKARHNRGVSYGLLHRYEEAVSDFSAAIKSKPGYANSWFNRAEIYYELGRYDRAIADYSQVLRKNPNDVAALVQRGHAHFRAKRVAKSIQDYQAAVKQSPQRADLYVFRGDARQSLGEWQKAAVDYRRAIQLDSKNAHAFRSSAWLMATCPDDRYRDPERGVEAARLAAELYRDSDFRTLDALAAAYANANNFGLAQKTIDQAIQSAPRSALKSLVRRQQMYKQNRPFRQPTRLAARPIDGKK